METSVPAQESAKAAGTKMTVTNQSGGSRYFCTSPSVTESPRYMTLAAATAPPGLKRTAAERNSSEPATNVPAVMSAKATMT